jgi:transposase InsO family protein
MDGRGKSRAHNGPALAGHGAEAVRDAIAAAITTMPEQPRRSLRQTMGREWAYGLSYRSHHHCNQALPHWLEHYNTRRPHSGIGNQPPISRVHNLRGQDT